MTDKNNNQIEEPKFEEIRDPFTEEPPEEETEEKPGSNRTFLTILGVIGSIIVLAIIVLVAFVLITRNRTAARFQEQAAQINATNTAISQHANETAAIIVQRQTEKALPPTWTPTSAAPAATNTPPPPTHTATTSDSPARTATIASFLTQVVQKTSAPTSTAGIHQTTTAGATATVRSAGTVRATSTALPTTGFAEDIGLPGLFGLALLLIVIMVLARRLRLSSNP